MKFQNGCWLLKEGFGRFSPQQVYDSRITGEEVLLCAPTRTVSGRGNTIDGINLTVRITAPMPEIIRVQTWHHRGTVKRGPEFALNLEKESSSAGKNLLAVEETESSIIIKSGGLSLVIGRQAWSMRYERDGKLLTKSGPGDLACLKENWKGMAYDTGGGAYMRQQLGLSVNEKIYGLGERFGAFVKNGQSVSIWNEDGGTSTEQSYKNIPFYLSDRGYGVFVSHPERVEFEVGTEQVNKVGFSVEGECLDYYLISGSSMKQVLERYTDLTGKPSLPAPWTFGLWLSTSFTTDYDEATVMHFVDGMLERGIPLSVFHFDCCWMKEFHWTDFIWDERVFPDPEGMLARIKAKGIKVCVWINPYMGQESALFEEGMEKGYFLKRPNGDVWQWDMWQSGMAIVDFTNPEAVKWYQQGLEKLLDMGVDCFKTDFGERIPTEVVYYNGADPMKMHNFYTYLYNKAVYELLERKRGKGEAVLFARSATAGGQKFPVHWGGDCWSDYESMEQSLRGGLSLTSSGFGFWSHDIGGFESRSTPDVYKRWCAFGLLSTHSRLHGSSSYRVPWLYDEESVEVVRFFTRLKASLMPYLYRNAIETARTGVPMMRSMALEFEKDRNCAYPANQYMLGDSLLVAPIFNEEGMAEYYLPEGRWTAFLTGEEREGGRWYREKHGYLSIPLYVRESSVVAVGACDDGPVYEYARDVTFRVYAPGDGEETGTVVYDGQAQQDTLVQIERQGKQYRVDVTGDKPCRVILVNAGSRAKVSGAAWEVRGKDIILAFEKSGMAQVEAEAFSGMS
ncbi:MAG: alpha-xylosidase [Lachnospiraceae bacterium]|nr:alpha-xylosidase [Lachnospiraceae bacterium]